MIFALFIIIAAVVVCLPIVGVVLVSMASHREESALSLDKPAPGIVQAAARRLLDFHTEEPAWPMPRYHVQARPAAPALRSVSGNPVGQPRRSTVADPARPVATSKASIRTAA
jgi:hypothetical protein